MTNIIKKHPLELPKEEYPKNAYAKYIRNRDKSLFLLCCSQKVYVITCCQKNVVIVKKTHFRFANTEHFNPPFLPWVKVLFCCRIILIISIVWEVSGHVYPRGLPVGLGINEENMKVPPIIEVLQSQFHTILQKWGLSYIILHVILTLRYTDNDFRTVSFQFSRKSGFLADISVNRQMAWVHKLLLQRGATLHFLSNMAAQNCNMERLLHLQKEEYRPDRLDFSYILFVFRKEVVESFQ